MAILFDWYENPKTKDKQGEELTLHPRIKLNGSTTTDEPEDQEVERDPQRGPRDGEHRAVEAVAAVEVESQKQVVIEGVHGLRVGKNVRTENR